MIHNGIEYGMMQALAEGFALLAARPELDIDLARRKAAAWRHGSVVRSWLLDLCSEILKDNDNLSESRRSSPIRAKAAGPRSTIELGVPAPAITAALFSRFSSQGRSDYAQPAARPDARGFGGHADPAQPNAAAAMIVIVMGVSGVGKTTIGEALALALGARYIDADDYHPSDNVAKMAAGMPLEDADRCRGWRN